MHGCGELIVKSGSAALLGGLLTLTLAACSGQSAAHATDPGPGANSAPNISGTPPSSVQAGSSYTFRPVASDSDGDALTFQVVNPPVWASFDTTTGALAGTPTSSDVGTYANITIRVTDGKATTSLAAFTVTVNQISTGSATLSWTPPTQNTDGSTLSNLAGYRVHYGTSSSALTTTLQVANPGIASLVVDNLAPATWFFSVRAYSASGAESDNSNIVSKTIP